MNPNDPQQSSPAVQPTVPAGPAGQPYVGGYGTPPVAPLQPAQSAIKPGRAGWGKRKLWIGLAAVLVVVGAACGYAFGFYLPNTPSSIYSSSLQNSGKALDQLVQYSRSQTSANYTGAAFDGVLHVKSPSGSFDINLNGAGDDKNASVSVNADILGQKASAELRAVTASGNTSPDLYLQVNGIKQYLDANGLTALDGLDGKWISVDHTLLDTYAASVAKSFSAGTVTTDSASAPTYAQIQDAVAKVQAVNKQYLFTEDQKTAVLANQKFLGQVTRNGHTLDHYRVGFSKGHLLAYVKAQEAALDSSKLNNWSKQANGGKSLSKAMDFSSLEGSIKNAKSDYTFELWADAKTKLVSELSFADPSSNMVMTLAQGYTGGSQYPFSMTINGKDGGDTINAAINLSVDTQTNKVTGGFTYSSQGADGTSSIDASLHITPGNTAVRVTAPQGATSITDLLNSYGLGDLIGNSGSGSGTPSDLSQLLQMQ